MNILFIFSEDICNMFLDLSLGGTEPEVMPKILCIGKMEKIKAQVWQHKGSSYEELSGDEKKKALEGHFANTLKTGFYVRSAGTCNGDSGGPVFVKSKTRVGY